MLGEKNDVFKLMDIVCTKFAEVSYQIHNMSVKDSPLPNGHRRLYENFVYTRMLWSKYILCLKTNIVTITVHSYHGT